MRKYFLWECWIEVAPQPITILSVAVAAGIGVVTVSTVLVLIISNIMSSIVKVLSQPSKKNNNQEELDEEPEASQALVNGDEN